MQLNVARIEKNGGHFVQTSMCYVDPDLIYRHMTPRGYNVLSGQ